MKNKIIMIKQTMNNYNNKFNMIKITLKKKNYNDLIIYNL